MRFESADVARYYDQNTASFLAHGQGGAQGIIRRAVWGEGVGSRAEAFHFVDDLLRSRITESGARRILDLGCGTGLSGARWRARSGQLVGIDLSPEMNARAAERGIYDRLETAEITSWLAGQRSDQFDLIVACDTLIYFGDLAQVMTKARARLRQTGLLAFTLERGTTHPFALSDSGRFTHHPDYVAGVVTAAGLTLLELDETFVRREYGEPVVGLIAVCGGSPSAAKAPLRSATSSLSAPAAG